jgi:hypothetical protein
MCLTCDDCEKQELLEAPTMAERLAKGRDLLHSEIQALADQREAETPDSSLSSPRDRAQLN